MPDQDAVAGRLAAQFHRGAPASRAAGRAALARRQHHDAALAGQPVRMAHLLRTARGEYAKVHLPLKPSDGEGWVASPRSRDSQERTNFF